MPLVPEQIIAMLACARIGAVHNVVFGGFGAAALNMRIQDAEAKVVITADISIRRGKAIQLKAIVDEAIHQCTDGRVPSSSSAGEIPRLISTRPNWTSTR